MRRVQQRLSCTSKHTLSTVKERFLSQSQLPKARFSHTQFTSQPFRSPIALFSRRHYTNGTTGGDDWHTDRVHNTHHHHTHERHTHHGYHSSVQTTKATVLDDKAVVDRAIADVAEHMKGNIVNQDIEQKVHQETEQYVWRRIAAEVGAANADFEIGSQYFSGQGAFLKDESQAVEWFTKSANLGHARAQNVLGTCYANHRGVELDQEKAIFWWNEAAGQGEAESQLSLGVLYANGVGVKKDEKKAFAFFNKAAEQGHPTALEWVAECYKAGFAVEKNDTKAQEFFMEAADARLVGEFEQLLQPSE